MEQEIKREDIPAGVLDLLDKFIMDYKESQTSWGSYTPSVYLNGTTYYWRDGVYTVNRGD